MGVRMAAGKAASIVLCYAALRCAWGKQGASCGGKLLASADTMPLWQLLAHYAPGESVSADSCILR